MELKGLRPMNKSNNV